MPKYTPEEFAKKMKALRRQQIILIPLIPMTLVVAALKSYNGTTLLSVVVSVALALLFTFSVVFRIPRKMEELRAEQTAE